MASFSDLSPCTFFPGEWRGLLAVGWLDASESFPTAEPDLALTRRILQRRFDWHPPHFDNARFQRCPLCPPEQQRGDRGYLFVPSKDALFVAPTLIAHFVREHRYAPPTEFIDAVNQPQLHGDALLDAIAPFFPALSTAPRGLNIQVLEGLEPIRRRPHMYVGHGELALTHLFDHAIDFSVNQGLTGRANRIDVEFASNGRVAIEHDGDGVPVEDGTSDLLRENFAQLHGMFSEGAPTVNGVSSEFVVETRHAGRAWRMTWECGLPIEPLTCLGATEKRGTRIQFRLDPELLSATDLAPVARARLHELAFLLPRVEFRLNSEPMDQRTLPMWIRGLERTVIDDTIRSQSYSRDDVSVEVAVGWSALRTEPLLKSFVNLRPAEGGVHADALWSTLTAVAPTPSAAARARSGLVALVLLRVTAGSHYQTDTQHVFGTDPAKHVRHAVRALLGDAPVWWDRILEHLKR